jgi:DNA-binding NtrC family response regulator
VRALENAIERSVLLAQGPWVRAEDLPEKVKAGRALAPAARLPQEGIDLRAAVEAFENSLIRDALDRSGWNKNRAAQLLGLNRTTLVEMVKRKRMDEMKPGNDVGT